MAQIKAGLDTLNVNCYGRSLENTDLKNHVYRKEAVEYFLLFQDALNNYYHSRTYDDYRKLVEDHEFKLGKILKMVPCGIVMDEIE